VTANPAALFDCLRVNRLGLVSAHRGGDGPGFAENALETFEHTLRQAPVLLEMDVRQSRDGVLVLMHDDTVDRTTTGSGSVAQMSAADLAALTLTDDFGTVVEGRVPTLDAALAWSAGRTILQLDIKRGVPFPAVVEAVRRAGAQARVILIVYSLDDAILVHRLDPSLMMSVSIDEEADLATLTAAGVDLSRVLAFTGVRAPNPQLNALLAGSGVEVIFGTLGGEGSLDQQYAQPGAEGGYQALVEGGVQLIATDRAIAAFEVLDEADGRGFGPARCLGGQP
jgi:glycerophosphoryl diester phosphodiesterase